MICWNCMIKEEVQKLSLVSSISTSVILGGLILLVPLFLFNFVKLCLLISLTLLDVLTIIFILSIGLLAVYSEYYYIKFILEKLKKKEGV